MREFRKRNKNLFVFNAVLHLDELSPHIHIDFIPFYDERSKRQIGLRKGVSLKSALDEQGFSAKNFKQNRLVAWEESERKILENLLLKNGIAHEIANSAYSHLDIAEFKKVKDVQKIIANNRSNLTSEKLNSDVLREQILRLKSENLMLKNIKNSPFKHFYYSSEEKRNFVLSEISKLGIAFSETENGFQTQEIFTDKIREIEKSFKPVKNSYRTKLREDVDKFLMQSNNFEEFLEKLQANYEVKQGKYLAVRAKTAKDFIRLKSLGMDYCEQALRNRITEKLNYEKGLDSKIQTAKSENFSVIIFKTARQYTKVFGQNLLPMKKKNPQKYFSWTNDTELEKIFDLNRKLGGGAVTLESLRFNFEDLEKNLSNKDCEISKLKEEINFFKELFVIAENAFNGSNSDTNSELLKQYSLTKENYLGLQKLISEDTIKLSELKKSADTLREKLKEISDTLTTAEQVLGGVYVQNLIKEETEKRKAETFEGRK
jgi:hypothetical protein